MEHLDLRRRERLMAALSKMQDGAYHNNCRALADFKLYGDEILLNVITSQWYNEDKVICAIKSLLYSGYAIESDPITNTNFIQYAINSGYSDKTIVEMLEIAVAYNFNINATDSNGFTIMHTAIIARNFNGSLEFFYDSIKSLGFNECKSNSMGNVVECINYVIATHTCSPEENQKLQDLRNHIEGRPLKRNGIMPKLNKIDYITLEDNGIILNSKKYIHKPTVGRDKELEQIYIACAQKDINPILVGPSGAGKTVLVDELVYQIKQANVPKYLKDQIVYEITPSDFVAGSKYRGDFEAKIKKVLEICLKNNVLVFIDEIHTIYGAGSSADDKNDLANILKIYIKRGLRVIGATTDYEYDKYFSIDALKRRFEKIAVKVPNEKIIRDIVIKRFLDLSVEYGINADAIIDDYPIVIDILLYATEPKRQDYFDQVNNPDFVISVVNKAFAYALMEESEVLNIDHIKNAINMVDRISGSVRETVVAKLDKIDTNHPVLRKTTRIDLSSRLVTYSND